MSAPGTAEVTLFKPGGKYYTTEEWRLPAEAIGPYDMDRSPDFRRIGGGPVLIDTQEPWGFPHLFPAEVECVGTAGCVAPGGCTDRCDLDRMVVPSSPTPSRYGAAFDRLADTWATLENEHDKQHPNRDECGGVGACPMMAAAYDLEQDMVKDVLKSWRRGETGSR